VIRHALAPIVPQVAGGLGLPRRLAPGLGGVALTFDDGPHPEGTPTVLDLLGEANVTATFFLIGEQVRRHPGLVARIVNEGHLAAVHGYQHRLQLRLGAREVAADVDQGAAIVADAGGAAPVWHRAPYGIYSPAGLEAVRQAGLRPLLWSRWGKDWRRFTTAARIARRAAAGAVPGDVILLHDADHYSARGSHRRTVEALGLILREFRRREIATVLPV
jgi:peptidoglycan/xylan/chitin deacetylase (PgdA/CDA1 family)